MTNRQSLAPRLNTLSIALSMVMLATAPTAFAQDQSEQSRPASTQASTLDTVTVVGSRIKRAEIEGPAPVTVITRADIDREGFQTVGDMLQSLTQQSTANFTGDLAVSGFTPNAQVVNLRGMGPGYTLTLINGRRPPDYPQPYNRDNNVVNVRMIPSAIVERVEVLTGGASAIYGSDAVAGVVNIVTRKNYDGNQIRVTAGTTAEGGGDSVAFEYTGGSTGDRWSTLYALQYNANEPVFASQREFLADTRNNPYGLTANPNLALVALSLGGVAARANHNAVYDAAACDAFGYTTVTTPARGTYCGSFTQPASRSISNKQETWATYVSGTFDVTNTLQLFGSASLYTSEASSGSGTEFWGTSGDRFTANPSGAATGYYYDAAYGDFFQLQRVFNPFELGGSEAATTLYDENYFDLTFGVNGVFGRFDWEASANYGEYEYENDRPRLLAKPVHDYFLGPQLGNRSNGVPIYALNLARWNSPITPEIYRSFATRVKNISETSSGTVNFNFSGDLFDLPAGPLSIAGVVEGTRQTMDLISDPRTDQMRPLDEQTIYNLTSSGSTSGERDRYAVGVEFRVPILDSLTANLAGRYDKYDDITAVDGAFTKTFGLEWRPFSSLLLRGSYATSFRAPDMQMVFAEGAASYSSVLDEYACRSGQYLGQTTGPRTVPTCQQSGDLTQYQTQSRIAGNPGLKEEEGESWGYGFVWDIIDNMSLSVDYYRIRLEDKASQVTAAYILQNEANCRLGVKRDGTAFENGPDSAFCQNIYGLITRTVAPGTALDGRLQALNTAYINTAFQEVSGVDANFRYRHTTDRWGRFDLDLGYTLRLTDKSKQFADDELVDYRDMWDYDPRSRVRGSLGWSSDDWSVTLFGTRLGANQNWAETDRLRPYITYNMQVGHRFTPNTKVEFTVVNLTDNQYRFDETYTSYPYFYYANGADPLGRRFFISMTHRF
ncbi:TonB-dependent receptor [Luteimonas yindakuii]|uniref:TonB-dependent receptor n=1 Tax=Luteimonas yindakuii TaxID=2565782 RepID=A0A4Z1RKY5_9GAMM|nr:TonB-dependent receptor [Luteimonas yindakuii]QCO68779.2 TonB-dependent receptor [Luteimonas yindakuii]TKS54271.1 TonB-dependent receptor [Luteimonas yindakuii]